MSAEAVIYALLCLVIVLGIYCVCLKADLEKERRK